MSRIKRPIHAARCEPPSSPRKAKINPLSVSPRTAVVCHHGYLHIARDIDSTLFCSRDLPIHCTSCRRRRISDGAPASLWPPPLPTVPTAIDPTPWTAFESARGLGLYCTGKPSLGAKN